MVKRVELRALRQRTTLISNFSDLVLMEILSSNYLGKLPPELNKLFEYKNSNQFLNLNYIIYLHYEIASVDRTEEIEPQIMKTR